MTPGVKHYWRTLVHFIASPRMASNEISPAEELVRLTRLADEAQSLSVVVNAQHEMRSAIRRAVVLQHWSQLESAQRELAASQSLASRFGENLHHVLETPELSAGEPFGRLHGLVLAIPVALTCKAGTLALLPRPLASTFRESLQDRFPGNVAMRLANRVVPQLAAHAMGARALYEMIRELASGAGGPAAPPDAQAEAAFRPYGRSLGQHYLFALALAPHHEDLAHYGDLQSDPGLVKWSAAQTEAITSNFAERGWPLLARVSTPMRLRHMRASPLLLSDVRELDGLLDHFATRQGRPITALGVALAMRGGEEAGVWIGVSDRRSGAALARAFYRLAPLHAEAGAYRVAVRLASAGVQLAAADEAVARTVERAIALVKDAPSAEAQPGPDSTQTRRLARKLFGARFSRPPRHMH
jgi:hypothetical protein